MCFVLVEQVILKTELPHGLIIKLTCCVKMGRLFSHEFANADV